MSEDERDYLRISALLHGASLLIRDAIRLSLQIGQRHREADHPHRGFNYRLHQTKDALEKNIEEADDLGPT